jgi:uncharacterized protein YndB with AHSA1/START domain
MPSDGQALLVRKSITVQAPVSHVFRMLTERLDSWWPRSHHIGDSEPFEARLEPRVGGRWYERGADGKECDWGKVLIWEPPYRIVLTWDISAEWRHDKELQTEVEIRLAEASAGTQVELEHRKLERYGDKFEAMRSMFDSPEGWSGVLASLAKAAWPSAAQT